MGLEKMRFQSIDRLGQRKLERKILQYKARQAMKFGEPETDEEEDPEIQNLERIDNQQPRLLTSLSKREPPFRDPQHS